MLNNFNKKYNFILSDQELGNIIRRDPLNLRFDPYNLRNSALDPPAYLRDPLNPMPGHSGPLGPLGKPTGRW